MVRLVQVREGVDGWIGLGQGGSGWLDWFR